MKTTGTQIKKEITKALNIKSSDLTCKIARNGTIRVEVKNPEIELAPIESVVSKYESIRYCEATGEILQGCNRFVFVNYTFEASLAKAQN